MTIAELRRIKEAAREAQQPVSFRDPLYHHRLREGLMRPPVVEEVRDDRRLIRLKPLLQH